MITGQDFVFTGLQPWDLQIGSNAKDMALEISKHNRVLYINTPLDKKTYHGKQQSPEIIQRHKVVQKQTPVIRQINQNLWVLDYPFTIWPANFLPDGFLFDFINKINNKKMYSFVLKILNQLHFNEYILFIDNDIYRSFYATTYLHPSISIYYRRDNFVTPFWKKHANRLEPLLCKKVHLIATNSIHLAEAVKIYNTNTYDIGQGVDISQFPLNKTYPIPSDMTNFAHPIIGYTGLITSKRLNADLLYEIVSRCPQFTFMMVGKEDEYFKNHHLHRLTNIHFVGEKNNKDIPSYIAAFDICINPQIINEITIGNYPRKIDEYLALGKPVIATRTKAMSLFEEYVWNCDSADAYIKAIHEAIQNKNDSVINSRIQFAHSHTWENSVSKLYQAIKSLKR